MKIESCSVEILFVLKFLDYTEGFYCDVYKYKYICKIMRHRKYCGSLKNCDIFVNHNFFTFFFNEDLEKLIVDLSCMNHC